MGRRVGILLRRVVATVSFDSEGNHAPRRSFELAHTTHAAAFSPLAREHANRAAQRDAFASRAVASR
jgi:hypothetical protein